MKTVILGIDPGINIIGFGLIEIINNEIIFLKYGQFFIKKNKYDNLRLKEIFAKILILINNYHPSELAIESPFLGKNIQSMLKLSKVLGVIIAAGLSNNLNIKEYSPKKIKLSVTGNGNASKEQIYKTIIKKFSLKINEKKTTDATDALAIAICHYFNK